MRALTSITTGVLTSVLLAGCGDQTGPTSSATKPSFARLRPGNQYTVGLTCSGAGNLTVATVTVVSPPNTFQLSCGSVGPASVESFNYHISLYDGSNVPVAECENNNPIRRTGSFTCKRDQSSATLTVAPLQS